MLEFIKRIFRINPPTDIKVIKDLLKENGFTNGRLISGSKSRYCNMYPDNLVVFNANIFTDHHGKIFHGDLDLTKDQNKLIDISIKTNTVLYVLFEMDGRFDNENRKDFKKVAVWNTKTGLSNEYRIYYFQSNLKKI